MRSRTSSDYTYRNHVQLIQGGKDFFSLLSKSIDEAQFSIYFQIYIFDEDETGKSVAASLCAAAKRGVHVNLLVDGYASKNLSDSFIQSLKEAGVQFRWFNSFIKNNSNYLGRRLHHKVIVFDEQRAFVCGLNISNRYNDTAEGKAWLDWAAYTEGEVASILTKICQRRIKLSTNNSEIKTTTTTGASAVKVNVNDWVNLQSAITRSYRQMMQQAATHVIIMSPYFLPGTTFRKLMRKAAKRGVTIQLILTGISDIPLAKYAERHLYHWMLKHSIQIFEYKRTVLHGKLATCDEEWTTVGSYNINNLSAYASIELNLEIKDKSFAIKTKKRLEQIMEEDCTPITLKDYQHEINIGKRFLQYISYLILRFMLLIFTLRKAQQE
ncbi:MAG: phospholipase [Cyclobacteriaceae bacterium]|nr:phospholipase [Cyclobacteriaceae bacterium]